MARKTKAQIKFQNEVLISVYALIIIALSIIGGFRFGLVGETLSNVIRILFGQYPMIFFILWIAIGGWMLFKRTKLKLIPRYLIASILLFIVLLTFLAMGMQLEVKSGFAYVQEYYRTITITFADISAPAYGGIFGALIYAGLSTLFDRMGTTIVLIVLALIALILIFGPNVFSRIKEKVALPKLNDAPDRPEKSEKKEKKQPGPSPLTTMIVDQQALDLEEPKILTMGEALKKQKVEYETGPSKKTYFMEVDGEQEGAPILDEDKKPKPATTSAKANQTSQEVVTDSTGTNDTILNYTLPSVQLLDKPVQTKSSGANRNSASSKGHRLIEILGQFGIEADLIATHIGPSVTKFEIKPNSNIKISRIQSIQDNLMMELAVKELRIEAPIPGKSAVGIEIPNIEMTPVRLSEVLKEVPADKRDSKLLVPLGKDLMGKTIFAQLDKMPHLLVAGATGSGKSVCVNSIITSLTLRATPDEVKMVLIDPKKVEFSVYKELPHLLCDVISDPLEASRALKAIVKLMENRYDLFSKIGVRNISGYNELLVKQPQDHLQVMPYMVVIIDELADLMAVAGKEVEMSIQRITQLARAAGIHLIVATQRPSVDVITGVIKANIPSRISFAVSSAIDSRTILDTSGAEKLLGYGDMLYVPIGEPNPIRIQGVFVSDDEVKRVAEDAKKKAKPRYDDAFIDLEGVEGNSGFMAISNDPLYDECKQYVIETQKASTSLLQRRFQLGYNRAARIIEALEENRIIGPQQGSKAREVYVKNENDE